MSTDVAAQDVETEERYLYLEPRPSSWRRQLFLKGRNMAVVHLVYRMRAEGWTPEEAAEECELPLPQVQEALAYYLRHRQLIEQEQDEERRYLESHGLIIDPPAVPR